MNFRLTVFSRSQSLNIKSYFVFSITHFITLIFFFRINLTRESGKTWIQRITKQSASMVFVMFT